jgi:hypothetical protein
MSDLRLDYDDHLTDAMDKVNAALAKVGLRFEDDGLPHDGFVLYTLKKIAVPGPLDPALLTMRLSLQ